MPRQHNGNLLPVSRETKQEIAVHLAGGIKITRMKLNQGIPIIQTRDGKSYMVESINDHNFSKLMKLWACKLRYLFLENHSDKAVLSNYLGLEVYCSVREIGI